MRLFLAGGFEANTGGIFKNLAKGINEEESVKLFLAGVESRPWVIEYFIENVFNKGNLFILESFFYMNEYMEKLIKKADDFLLDSGAFTFMSSSKNTVNWEDYIKRYADFINRNDIKKFFELDIDSVVGYKKVLEYRKMLEDLTGKKSIPVWHKSRGKQDFIDTCKNYSYVAIGGIVSGEMTKDDYKYFPFFIDTAHKYGAKIHGLGFTSLDGIKQYHFDSVDSTAWTTGNRFGYLYQFDGKTIQKKKVPAGKRLADSKKTAIINFTEWVKFSEYVEKNY